MNEAVGGDIKMTDVKYQKSCINWLPKVVAMYIFSAVTVWAESASQDVQVLMLCASSSGIDVSGDTQGSLEDIFTGERFQGQAKVSIGQKEFLSYFRPEDRLQALRIYNECLARERKSTTKTPETFEIAILGDYIDNRDFGIVDGGESYIEVYLNDDHQFDWDLSHGTRRQFITVSKGQNIIKFNPYIYQIRAEARDQGRTLRKRIEDQPCEVLVDVTENTEYKVAIILRPLSIGDCFITTKRPIN